MHCANCGCENASLVSQKKCCRNPRPKRGSLWENWD